jgi:hypothetical protein
MEQCMNIKSKHYKNIKCSNKATVGEFCKKHSKNPIRFSSSLNISVTLIQKVWQKYIIRQNYKRQGFARNNYSIANNCTDIYSLEDIKTIPKKYFFSFYDTQKNVWAFDIRSLSYLLSKSKEVQNPYTRELLSLEILTKIKERISWLKEKKYSIMYEDNTILTNDQIWNQNVLNVFTKIDEIGYIVNPDWFHHMDKEDHIIFYRNLYDIWNYRIGLTIKEKNYIVPGFNTRNKLFKYYPIEIIDKEEKYLKKMNLVLIQKMISSVTDKTQNSLGVMYVLMGLSYVSESVAETFPWIYDTIN